MSIDLSKAQAFNCVAWLLNNKVVNEQGYPIEFKDHSFLIEPFLDETPKQVARKCSQIGWSTLAILRSFHLARYAGANIIHTFPSRNMSKEFVQPKVDPLINKNPVIRNMVGVDSMNLKGVGDRFIYYRGSYEQTEAISISAHILINDEYDRSNQKVLKTYRSRLDDARRENPELGWEWQFSNPTVPGKGVDQYWQDSDQKHWFVKCRGCGHDWFLKWPESVNMKTQEKICLKCGKAYSREDLQNGRWVRKYNNKEISGYWVSQLFVPWIPAAKIIAESKGDLEIFHNFTLGMPYISKDTTVTRNSIVKCISPGFNPKTSVAIGVDNGITKHYVIGNRTGIFEIGTTKDWGEIEQLRKKYSATMVIDALPYPNTPQKLAEAYVGKVYIHYYQQDRKQIGIVRWDGKTVRSDRTKVFDAIVAEINAGDLTFNMTTTQLEDYIHHWEQVYRMLKETPLGTMKPKWETIENKPDHYAHATILWRIALEKTLSFGGIVRAPAPGDKKGKHPVVTQEGTVKALDLQDVIRRAKKRKFK